MTSWLLFLVMLPVLCAVRDALFEPLDEGIPTCDP